MDNSIYVPTDLGVSHMSDSELANIALNKAGIIGTITNPYLYPKSIPYRENWRFVWTITSGTGKKGTLILKPCSDTAREITHEGIVKYLTTQFTINYQTAVLLANTACKIKYGSEPAVLECVLMTYNDLCWKEYPGQGNGVNYWRLKIKCLEPFTHLTVPRLETVYALVKRYQSVLKHNENFNRVN